MQSVHEGRLHSVQTISVGPELGNGTRGLDRLSYKQCKARIVVAHSKEDETFSATQAVGFNLRKKKGVKAIKSSFIPEKAVDALRKPSYYTNPAWKLNTDKKPI